MPASAGGSEVEGLSPRARGNREVSAVLGVGRGSIPACAGEPIHPGAISIADQVYPRVRGGTCSRIKLLEAVCGLSPRARGNRSIDMILILCDRSIPACAGEPHGGRHRARGAAVYPRVRGGTT